MPSTRNSRITPTVAIDSSRILSTWLNQLSSIGSFLSLVCSLFHRLYRLSLDRAALDALRPFVEANAFLRLQGIWGGSHDVILGLVLWLAEVDLFSFAE